jgi:hypothetical protein
MQWAVSRFAFDPCELFPEFLTNVGVYKSNIRICFAQDADK